MKSPLTRLALLVAATAVSVPAPDALAGVVDGRYDLQYYLDFCRNKGMFATGATNIEVFFKDGTSIANNTIPLMPNMDSYGQTVSSILNNKVSSSGGTNLVSAQFVYGAKHVHAKAGNSPVAFLTENGNANCVYYSANLDNFGTDSSMQRLTKLVTSVAYTPMADDAFMRTLKVNDTWFYRIGNGGTWCDGKSIPTGDNSLGGVVNLSVCWQDNSTGEWYLEGWARKNDITGDTLTPLDIGTYFGDSGSPFFTWDDANNRFVFVGAMWAGGCQLSFPNWYLPRYNYRQGSAVMEKYTVVADKFSGTEKIVWGKQDSSTGKGVLTQTNSVGKAVSVDYIGQGSSNNIADTRGLTFSTTDTINVQTLELAGNVNMGAGAMTFKNGTWRLTETANQNFSLSSAGFDIQKEAALTWELKGSSSQEIRKVGEGTLTIAGSGNNESTLVVGGGTTVYNVVRDENGNITDCTIGNAGETRLDRTGGYAASSVRLEGGVAIVVLMQDGQFKTNTTAGDTFSFGNAGGLLNLNGHNLEWGVIKQEGSGTGARIGNFTPLGGTKPQDATFTYTGTNTFAGSFMDEAGAGTGSARLAVVYNNATADATWTLTGHSTNSGGYTVQDGTMILEGTLTPHVNNFRDANDWTYASIQTSGISVESGASFKLSHHAFLKGNVSVANGGSFILSQTVNATSESVSGSRRQNMADIVKASLVGDVTLKGTAAMEVSTNSPVATTIQGNISGETESVFTKTGSGVFVINGKVSVGAGTIEAGGVAVKNKDGFTGTWTIQKDGYLGVEGMNGDDMLPRVSSESTGILALGANQTTAITNLENYSNLYIGALGIVEYGTTNLNLAANTNKQWLLGGGGGTLNVNFKLSGANSLIIGTETSGGTVHLANAGNDFSGDIIIKGTGNILTYVEGALGSALVTLSYGNALGLYNVNQLSILKEGSEGVLALTSSYDLDLSGKKTAIGAVGDLTYKGALTVSDTYRFGGSGNLILDTDLSKASAIKLDGQGMTGSSVTFARENAFTGAITAGGGLHLSQANSTGDISIHVEHEKALASVSSMTMQKGAMLDTDGRESLVIRNLSAESGASIKNSGSTATLLQLDVSEGASTTIADGVLVNTNNNASLSIVKTGTGTLTMGVNSSWNGGLTIMSGTVSATLSASGTYNSAGGIGSTANAIYVDDQGTLSITGVKKTGHKLAGTEMVQQVLGTGTIQFSTGGSAFFSTQSSSFEGTITLTGNTRVYLGTKLDYNGSGNGKNTLNSVQNATIKVTSGSQVRITSGVCNQYAVRNSVFTDFIISGSGFSGSYAWETKGDSLTTGALAIDFDSTVYGNVTLADNATISSSSNGLGSNGNKTTSYYGIKGYLGGTIRGKILGTANTTLTFGGNEGMTITADSANTFGNLVIANGNGNNDDKFALRLNGGTSKSQTSTALGTGTVTLNKDLILRLGGNGVANSSNIVYTYGNAMSVGENATIQSYNITNRLTGTVNMGEKTALNLATASGGVLELAGGISGNGTLNVGANSKIILGSASSTMSLSRSGSAQFSGNVVAATGADITLMSPAVVSETTTFTGTDSLTLRLAGTEDYTLGGITVEDSNSSDTVASSLTLSFDFTDIPSASDINTYTTLTSAITASNVQILLDLNMFNDIAGGEYTLLNGNLNVANYSLTNNLNGRLHLNSETSGKLVLVVDTDNRLYWRSNGTTRNWNTTESNWHKEGLSALTAFTTNSDVVFDSTGITNGSSASSRETVTLTENVTVGNVSVKDSTAHYEVTGSTTLTGTSLVVGLGGDLKLSTTSASFTNGVRVDNAKLEVNKTTLTANVSITNGASFTLSNSATLTGALSVTDGTVSVNNSSISGNITTQGSGTATLNSLTLTGEITGATGGRIIAGTYNGTSTTYSAATLSGTLNWGGETGSSLSLTSSSLYLDGAVNLTELSVGTGTTVTVWNSTGTSGTEKTLGTVKLGNNAVFQTNDRAEVTAATHIETLQLEGNTATLQDVHHSGSFTVNTLKLGEGVNSSNLILKKNAASTWSTIFELGNATAEAGNFVGTITLNEANGGGKRSAFIILSGSDIAKNAVISFADAQSGDAHIGLGINTASATIAGLSSVSNDGTRSKLFSGTINEKQAWNTGDTSAPATVGDTLRTLTINTASETSHAFYGEVMSNLRLVKTGAGTQTLAGASSSFNGGIFVEAGTLIAGHANALGTGAISVASGAVLQANAEITLSAASQALTLVVGEEQIVPAVATYAALRSADATGTALITKGEGTNGKISVSGDAVVYVDVSALTKTPNLISGDTISLQLATESALDFNNANAQVGWWDDSGTNWTNWAVASNYNYDSASGLLTITIPEPSTFGLLAGLSALALCVSRRKRRK